MHRPPKPAPTMATSSSSGAAGQDGGDCGCACIAPRTVLRFATRGNRKDSYGRPGHRSVRVHRLSRPPPPAMPRRPCGLPPRRAAGRWRNCRPRPLRPCGRPRVLAPGLVAARRRTALLCNLPPLAPVHPGETTTRTAAATAGAVAALNTIALTGHCVALQINVSSTRRTATHLAWRCRLCVRTATRRSSSPNAIPRPCGTWNRVVAPQHGAARSPVRRYGQVSG